jgi:hypothetical protein
MTLPRLNRVMGGGISGNSIKTKQADEHSIDVGSHMRIKTVRKSVVFTAQEDSYVQQWANSLGVSDQDIIRRAFAFCRKLRDNLEGHDLILKPHDSNGTVKQIIFPDDLLG